MRSEHFWSWFDGHAVPRLKGGNPQMNRVNTFRAMFEHLDGFEEPLIVETGCIEEPDNWVGNGCSTIMFDKYADFAGGFVRSVDIDRGKASRANALTGERTTVACADSVAFLKALGAQPEIPALVYLDASHLNWQVETEAQVHHFLELKAIWPRLAPDTMVAVDDSPAILDENGRLIICGKGGLVARHAGEVGAALAFTEYQSGWTGFPGSPERTDEAAEEILGRARWLLENGEWAKAHPLYRSVLVRTPPPWNGVQRVMHGEACAFFARLALQHERPGAAFDWFKRALEADPMAADYRVELVNKAMLPLGMTGAAKSEAERATKIEPSNQYAWRTLGLVEGRLNNAAKSLAAHEEQARLTGRSTVALLDVVATLVDVERYEEAATLLNEVEARDPNDAMMGDVRQCQAMILARHGDHEAAIQLFEDAIEIGCCDPTLCHFHLSLSLHSIGRYREGWAHHSMRAKNASDPALFVPMRRFDRPLFTLDAPPSTVHVHAEAGAGDNIAMLRYLPLLREMGHKVRYECRDELLELARFSLPGVEVVPMAKDYPGSLGLRDFDLHCPVGELPHAFGTEVDTVPWSGPYLSADPGWAERFAEHKGKIGLAWSSGIRPEGIWLKRYGELKSLKFRDVGRLLWQGDGWTKRAWERMVSLQVGSGREENDKLLLADVLSESPTWAETAGLLANLDLVITPDTGLAHLAGAMGKRTILLMHCHNSGWHFMCERPGAFWNERSPWYPSVTVVRQRESGRWDDVVDRALGMVELWERTHDHAEVAEPAGPGA